MAMRPGALVLRALAANMRNFRTPEFGFELRDDSAHDVFLQIDRIATLADQLSAQAVSVQ